MNNSWVRVTTHNRCPICNHIRWCAIRDDGHVRCMFPDDANPPPGWSVQHHYGDGGLLYGPGDSGVAADISRLQLPKAVKRVVKHDWDAVLRKVQRNITSKLMKNLAKEVGVEDEVVASFGVGWDGRFCAYAIPMFDPGNQVVGIHLRKPDGTKLCVKGSTTGLFLSTLPGLSESVITEGATDAMAAAQLGLWPVGRSGASVATKMLQQISKGLRITIIADADAVGIRGGKFLCDQIRYSADSVAMIVPSEGKDVREWLSLGATKEHVAHLIEKAHWKVKQDAAQEQIQCLSG